jgi:hypothetical protein
VGRVGSEAEEPKPVAKEASAVFVMLGEVNFIPAGRVLEAEVDGSLASDCVLHQHWRSPVVG